MHNVLSTLILIPLIGAAFILFVPKGRPNTLNNIRWIALITTLVTFGVSLLAWQKFDPTNPAFQLIEEGAWISQAIRFKLGVDGYSMPFILLSTFLMPFLHRSRKGKFHQGRNVGCARCPIHRHDGDEHEYRTQQCVEEEFEARINTALAAPHTDDEEHRNEARFEKHIEKYKIKRREDANHECFKNKKRDHIFSDTFLY